MTCFDPKFLVFYQHLELKIINPNQKVKDRGVEQLSEISETESGAGSVECKALPEREMLGFFLKNKK